MANGKQGYVVEVEDVDFEPTEAYLASMEEMIAKLSPEEIDLHNQEKLNFLTEIPKESPLNSISNYPNPFNTTTTIEFNLVKDQDISLHIYDLTGRLISVLLENETRLSGQNQVVFDGSNLTEGVYFYTIQSDGFTETKKMVLRK